MITTQMNPKIVAVASILKKFSRHELTQLVAMVPALKEPQPSEEEELLAHFRQLGREQRGGRAASFNDAFIGNLTYGEYFALSEKQQDAFWEQVFAEAAVDMEAMAEIDITDQDVTKRAI